MNQLRAAFAVSGALLLAVLLGPLSAPPAHAQEGAPRITPPPGKALLYIFRSDHEPRPAQVPIAVNAVQVGELENGTYLPVTVDPGRTFVRAGDRVLTVFTFETAADKTYFVWVEAVHGATLVQTDIRVVTEDEGRRSLEQSRLAPPPVISLAPPKPEAAPQGLRPTLAAAPAATPGVAASPQEPDPGASGRNWEIALTVNTGSFKLDSGSQVVAGDLSTYDTTSKPVYGFQVEWRSKSGLAAGGEFFFYRNTLTALGLTTQQDVLAYMVNGKYYFHATDWFYPYVGVGVGFTAANYTGNVTGTGTGNAFQGMAGLEFRTKHVGLNVQYKYLSSTSDDGAEKVKVGGKGVLAGVSIIF